jgi:hypothetical protein
MKETCAQVQKKWYHSQANGMEKKGPQKNNCQWSENFEKNKLTLSKD